MAPSPPSPFARSAAMRAKPPAAPAARALAAPPAVARRRASGFEPSPRKDADAEKTRGGSFGRLSFGDLVVAAAVAVARGFGFGGGEAMGSRMAWRGGAGVDLAGDFGRAIGLDAGGKLDRGGVHDVVVVFVVAAFGSGGGEGGGGPGSEGEGVRGHVRAESRGVREGGGLPTRVARASTRGRGGGRRGGLASRGGARVLLVHRRLELAVLAVHLAHPGRRARVVSVGLSPVRPREIALPRLEADAHRLQARGEIAARGARARRAGRRRRRAIARDGTSRRLHCASSAARARLRR